MNIVDAVRRANRPGPPEHSITLRVACAGAVVTGIAACRAEGELSWSVAGGSVALVVAGMILSYRTRQRPLPWIKPILAGAAVVAFVWFFRQLTGQAFYDVSTVEDPLAVLFVWVQVAHAFDVPARRDLAFSLAGSASLMAVAAAQAIDMGFAVYVVAWMATGLVGLVAMWGSASEGGRMRTRGVVATLGAVLVTGTAALMVLPAPHVAGRIDFPSAAGPGGQLPVPGSLAGDGRVAQLAKPGSPAGRSRVGGYLGFANRLDTALRGSLGDTVVMRVRAQRPSYWVGETFDEWDGANWNATTRSSSSQELTSGSPFVIPGAPSTAPDARTDLQTFYVVQSSPNLVFHADAAREVWFPAHEVFTSASDAIVSPIALGPGAIYTVQSVVASPSPDQLRAVPGPRSDPAPVRRTYLQLPHPYARAQALAASVTAASPTTYGKVESLIGWIGRHTHYSTDIPPLAPGQDTVDEFLFGNRTGFCEQISTAMAVMLRSIGIPAREAVGFVPGPYNPITDLYDVQARDAHAWVQVWFPGYGWQSFDPTAVVPAANPSPGSTLVHDAAGAVARLPWLVIGPALAAGAVAGALWTWRRRRPRTWAEQAARAIEAAGRRAGRPRRPDETLSEHAAAIDAVAGDRSETWRALAAVVEASAYGGRHPTPEDGRRLLASMRTLRTGLPRPAAGGAPGHEGGGTRGTGPGPEPPGAGPGPALTTAGGRAPGRSSLPPRAGGGNPSADGGG
jgi:transglutaminase-like putative cysteine protease